MLSAKFGSEINQLITENSIVEELLELDSTFHWKPESKRTIKIHSKAFSSKMEYSPLAGFSSLNGSRKDTSTAKRTSQIKKLSRSFKISFKNSEKSMQSPDPKNNSHHKSKNPKTLKLHKWWETVNKLMISEINLANLPLVKERRLPKLVTQSSGKNKTWKTYSKKLESLM